MKLTANFADTEFDVGERYPDQWRSSKLLELAALAQWLRDLAGSPGRVTSAFRSPARNAEVGGTETSQHKKGEAIDIVFPLASLRAIAEQVLAAKATGRAPPFGQLIFYADKGHIHASLATLGIRNGETRFSFVEGGRRLYPFLTAASQLPALTGSQAKAGGTAAIVVVVLAGAALLYFLSGGGRSS